jgi:murein DD-endopeptidase MepM/ murein hydrolase activator NlpD
LTGRRLRALFASAAALAIAGVALRDPLAPPRGAAAPSPVVVPVDTAPTEVADTLRRGETLTTLLGRLGFPVAEAERLARQLPAADVRRLRPGLIVRALRPHRDTVPRQVELPLAIDRLVRLTHRDTAWHAHEERLAWITDTVRLHGVISSSLYAAMHDGADAAFPRAARTEVAWALADILEYRVDMSRELQAGDSIDVLVERQRAANGAVRPGAVLAARLTLSGKPTEAVRFTTGTGRVDYFDAEGRSLRAMFLRAPLAFRRISSGFGMRRHPILGTMRRHTGLDYAAAAGTPVRAIGDGLVVFAGWKGGYGKTIEIRHRNGYVTRYGHLRGFAPGIRRGAAVAQARTIGFVGSTGLSSGPHLHFEFLVGGAHRDPRTVLAARSGETLAGGERPAFALARDRLLGRLVAAGPLAAPRAPAAVGSGDGDEQ